MFVTIHSDCDEESFATVNIYFSFNLVKTSTFCVDWNVDNINIFQ